MEKVNKFNSRIPRYNDDSDYTTNAPSYYDDLARKNILIKKLSERIWGYDKTLNEYIEVIDGKIKIIDDKINEGFNKEIHDLLVKWLEDGTLDHIINETLMNKKADLDYVNERFAHLSTYIPLDNYKHLFDGNDVSKALKEAIAEAPKGVEIRFNPKQSYIISDTFDFDDVVFKIDKPVKINFNHAHVEIQVMNKVVFDLLYTGNNDFNSRIELVNYFFTTRQGYVPVSIIRTNQAINSLINGNMNQCTCSHSLIHNWKGYGTHIFGEYRYNVAPRTFYFSHSNTTEEHSFAMYVDVDITGTKGRGIEVEGGGGEIYGVIEDCDGGYFYNGKRISVGYNIHVHFEGNRLYDMHIGTDDTNDGGKRNQGLTNISGSFFSTSNAPEKSIIFGRYQVINIRDTWLSKPLQPLSTTLTSDTHINSYGVYNSFLEVPEEFINHRGITLTTSKRGFSRVYDVQAKTVSTDDLNVKNPAHVNSIRHNGTFRLSDKTSVNNPMIFSDENILPVDMLTNLGGAYNRWKSVYTRDLILNSPDGSAWNIRVNDNGELSATKLEV